MNLFAKAFQNLPLSPAERATLRLVEGLAATVGLAFFYAVAQYLGGHDLTQLNLQDFARFSLGALLLALVMTGLKYVKAHADPAVGAALDPVAANVSQAVSQWADIPNDVVQEIDHATDSAGTVASVADSPATPSAASADTPAA